MYSLIGRNILRRGSLEATKHENQPGVRLYAHCSGWGVAEPVGAVIGYAILSPFLTPLVLSSSLAFVAGIMVYISLDEILPLAHRYGREHLVLTGVGAGMLVMAISLFLLA